MSGPLNTTLEALAGQVSLQTQTAGTFEDIKARAQQKLAGIREFFDSQGAGAYEAASQIIHDGIEELKTRSITRRPRRTIRTRSQSEPTWPRPTRFRPSDRAVRAAHR